MSDVCTRPLCRHRPVRPTATHELVVANRILPICGDCADDALASGDFVRVPGHDIIVMQIAENESDEG